MESAFALSNYRSFELKPRSQPPILFSKANAYQRSVHALWCLHEFRLLKIWKPRSFQCWTRFCFRGHSCRLSACQPTRVRRVQTVKQFQISNASEKVEPDLRPLTGPKAGCIQFSFTSSSKSAAVCETRFVFVLSTGLVSARQACYGSKSLHLERFQKRNALRKSSLISRHLRSENLIPLSSLSPQRSQSVRRKREIFM